jgi:hypothetical protein
MSELRPAKVVCMNIAYQLTGEASLTQGREDEGRAVAPNAAARTVVVKPTKVSQSLRTSGVFQHCRLAGWPPLLRADD